MGEKKYFELFWSSREKEELRLRVCEESTCQ